MRVRIDEMKKIYTELERLQLGPQFDEIREFHRVCNDYVRTGDSVSGSIPIASLRRFLVYHFPASTQHPCIAYLKAE